MSFITTSSEHSFKQQAIKLSNYYSSNFYTNYPIASTRLPMGRTIEDTLVYDNWISKTVNRYASAAVGESATVEVEDIELQASLKQWHDAIEFSDKLTSIARYQSLHGYAVVKLILKHKRTEDGEVEVAGKTADDLLADIDLAVFGADNSSVRYDEYGNVDCIVIYVGERIECFYTDRLEVYENKNGVTRLLKTETNPLAPMPLAFVVSNTATGTSNTSDVAGIVTLQESLNDALTSLRLMQHYHGFPIYTATGVSIAYDEKTGNPKPLVMGAGMTLQSESPDTTFGRVEMPAITPLQESIETLTREIAVATNSLSLLTGQVPSGTALSYMLEDFNSKVNEKRSRLVRFMQRLHRVVFALLDYALGTDYRKLEVKAYASGHNPIQSDINYQQAKELYALGALSLKTLLDKTTVVDSTQAELDRILEEKRGVVTATTPSLSSLLGG